MHTTQGTGSRRQTRFGRARLITGAVALPAALLLLAGCSVTPGSHGTLTVSGQAGPADAGQTPSAASSSPSSTGSTPGSTGSGSGSTSSSSSGGKSGGSSAGSHHGCAAGGSAIPSGAGRTTTVDLDGDGRADTLWLADVGNRRELGVATASGARLATVYSSASPESATAVAGRLGNGDAIVLLDTGRSVALYAVTGCRIVPTNNAQGAQYTFDKGFTGFGTGVGCPELTSAGRSLVGYLAKGNSKGQDFKVTRTTIELSQGGARAANGPTTTIDTNQPSSASIVKIAQSVACGTGKPAAEPVS